MTATGPAPIGVISQYNLLERLDPSGPGDLFRARDTRVGRTVMIRLLPAGYPTHATDRTRLFADAKSVIALSHPNITTLYEAGEHEGRVFLAFEFLKGQPLRAEMAGRPMNVRRAVELAIQIADGMAEAHGAGFLHSGLSPETVVITAKGHAKIPAFELASRFGFDGANAGERLRDYDSPEEARGQAPDERSDVYSIGAVLYEMLTTKRPMHKGAAAPSASNAHVLKELDEIVLRGVAPNPDSRIQSAAALAAELRGVLAVLDSRGGAGDEQEEPAAAATSFGKVLLVAVGVLLAAALLLFAFT
jgi:eukaryotic-like serine/threonine-protein kinase